MAYSIHKKSIHTACIWLITRHIFVLTLHVHFLPNHSLTEASSVSYIFIRCFTRVLGPLLILGPEHFLPSLLFLVQSCFALLLYEKNSIDGWIDRVNNPGGGGGSLQIILLRFLELRDIRPSNRL
jgi:hypothetical protein